MTNTATDAPFRVYFSDEAHPAKGRQVFGVRYFVDGAAEVAAGYEIGSPLMVQRRSVDEVATMEEQSVYAGLRHGGLFSLTDGNLTPFGGFHGDIVDWVFTVYHSQGERGEINWGVCYHPDGSSIVRWGRSGRLSEWKRYPPEAKEKILRREIQRRDANWRPKGKFRVADDGSLRAAVNSGPTQSPWSLFDFRGMQTSIPSVHF